MVLAGEDIDDLQIERDTLLGREQHDRATSGRGGMMVELHRFLLIQTCDRTTRWHGVCRAYSKPFTAAGFGGWFREMCNEAGLPRTCSGHVDDSPKRGCSDGGSDGTRT